MSDNYYRGRNEMSLSDFIADVELCNFRSPYDTGANVNAMMLWNILREYAGLERLTRDDLIQNYADIDGNTFETQKEICDVYDSFRRNRRR